MADQYLRKVGLLVYTTPQNKKKNQPIGDRNGLDLSNFRIQFQVEGMDVGVPPTAVITVWNLADETSKQIENEFEQVTLQAGYENGNFGIIFQGNIVRVERGRANAVDSYITIMAAWDLQYLGTFLKLTLGSGSTLKQRIEAVMKAAESASQGGLSTGNIPASFAGSTLPRGKVMFGVGIKDHLDDFAATGNSSWFIDPTTGEVHFVEEGSYIPSDAVVLTAKTGLIGVPKTTTNGINLTCLLNPMIKIGRRIQLDNKSITTTVNRSAQGFPAFGDLAFFASTANDGFYRTLVVSHVGDTRGTEWYTRLVCLNLDPSAAPSKSVPLT